MRKTIRKISAAALLQKEPGTFQVLWAFLRLGLTSFGGPIAHLGYFQEEFVRRRRWVEASTFAELVALCQLLPGPSSSQVGISIGYWRAGIWGGLAAWLGFTLPSALLMGGLALGLVGGWLSLDAGWIHGLKLVAVAVVLQAVVNMARTMSVGLLRATISVVSALLAIGLSGSYVQLMVIGFGALAGGVFLDQAKPIAPLHLKRQASLKMSIFCLALFVALLVALPVISVYGGGLLVRLADSFYRVGALVFGGGHVVLPLMKNEIVNAGWMSSSTFVAGYGAAQAIPGPMFSLAAYVGAVTAGWVGASVALVAIFLPSFLLLFGFLPHWAKLRQTPRLGSVLQGVNASVVGLLAAALYNPIWTSSILTSVDFVLALLAFLLLVVWQRPPWQVVVVICALTW